MKHQICDACETVAHCSKNGCIPVMRAQPPAPEQQAPQEEAATIRTWHKNGNQHAELMDWGAALDTMPDGLHKVYLPPAAPEAAEPETERAKLAKKLIAGADWQEHGIHPEGPLFGAKDMRRIAALLAADSKALPPECDVRKILLKVVPGEDGMGEEIFASSVSQIEDELTRLGEELEEWQLGIKRHPEADSKAGGEPVAYIHKDALEWLTDEDRDAHAFISTWLHKSAGGDFDVPIFTRPQQQAKPPTEDAFNQAMEDHFDALGDDENQGLHPYWKGAFRDGAKWARSMLKSVGIGKDQA